jgi:hypothetical protein
MKARPPSWIPWAAFAIVALLYVGGAAFSVLDGAGRFDVFIVATLAFPMVGVLISSRQPRNPIGWILLGIGSAFGLGSLVDGYVRYALETEPGWAPPPDLVLALTSWWWVPAVGLMGTFLILLFPDGRLPSPRWRAWAWLSAIVLVVISLVTIVIPGPFDNAGFPRLSNPLGLEMLRPILDAVEGSVLLLVVCILGCAVGLVRRFRRSRGQERLQMKWLTAAAVVTAAAYALLISGAGYVELSREVTPAWLKVVEQITFSSFVLIPVAVGIAVLRHRLYDIDVIINRTLVFGALTAALALIYVAGVFGVGAVVRALTRQESNNLAVAASTLAVAGVFGPLRRRLQLFIDRRFYRRKYDAEQTLANFSARLRDQVELESLTTELVGAVNTTMQPRHVSLWVKSPDA